MGRYFNEHQKSRLHTLNGIWSFSTAENQKESKTYVPSVWNCDLGMLEYEGKCRYKKEFFTSKDGMIRLHFGAVMTKAEIWIDGTMLEGHYGGFCEFDRFVYVKKGSHILTVDVDNSFDAHSVPQATVDWYHYGGITRDVYFEELQGICILKNHFKYELSSDLSYAEGYFTAEVFNAENKSVSSPLTVYLDGKAVYSENIALEPHQKLTINTPKRIYSEIKLWSPDSPNLYEISAETESYDLIDRIGFRKIEVKDGKILLNGKNLEFKGVNRHEDHPDHGMAFPVSLMKRDIDIIKDMGANAVRGSHYPNSREFIDMLDEEGLLFWSEIPVWGVGFSEKTLGDPIVVERILTMHKEMLEHYYNHPSIVIFGMHNEILTGTQNAYELTKKCDALLRPICGNRLITYASARPFEDICFEFCDIICINAYYGWYDGEIDYWDTFTDKFKERRKLLGFEEKPVIMSEFGAAAIYGNHTFDCIRWSEEYQAALMEKCLTLFHEDEMFAGSFIWQFCDIRTSKEMGLNRARSFNNKGILNEHRKPKTAYLTVKNKYRSF